MAPRHLLKLPEKSYAVAPGTLVGGLVFVMDKPCGIEEGMVGISMDSEPYRDFIRDNLQQFNVQISERLRATNTTPIPKGDKLIDWILKDSQIKKKGFFNPSYTETGLSGLFFERYKKSLNIDDKEKFYKQIAKLTAAGNKVYMVKQDGPMVLGGSGPTIPRIKMTTTYKKNKKKYGSIIANTMALGQRIFYIFNNKPKAVNEDATVEALSTKIAGAYGMYAQEIDTVEGTYNNGEPKVCTLVTWNNGCNDLSGHLLGGEPYYVGNVCVSSDANQDIRFQPDGSLIYKVTEDGHTQFKKHTMKDPLESDPAKIEYITVDSSETEYESSVFTPIKVANDGETVVRVELIANNLKFQKINPDGTTEACEAIDYQNAYAVSDHNIHGMGESLITLLSLGDRDGIGKKGQNKAIMPILDSAGKPTGEYKFFGIDFGKAYADNPNKLLESLCDNFYVDTFDDKGPNTCFPNYAMLYDNPLTDKMKGVYLLAAQKGGVLTDNEIEAIAKDYEVMGEKNYAIKLRAAAKIENKDSHLTLVQATIDHARAEIEKPDNKKHKKQLYARLGKLEEMKDIIIANDAKILNIFEKRIHLTPTQINLLDNIEKLTAKTVSTSLRNNTSVRLNHIQVANENRVPWQLKEGIKPDTYELYCENIDNLIKPNKQLLIDFLSAQDLDLEDGGNTIAIKGLTADKIQSLSVALNEETVADKRNLKFRTEADRQAFNQKMDIGQVANVTPSETDSLALETTFEVTRNTRVVDNTPESEATFETEMAAGTTNTDDLGTQKDSPSPVFEPETTARKRAHTQAFPSSNMPPSQQATRRRTLATNFNESTTTVSEQNRNIVLQETDITLETLKAKLSEPKMQQDLGIKKVCSRKLDRFKNNPGLEIEFEIKDSNQVKQSFKGYAEEIPAAKEGDKPKVEYSMEKNIHKDIEQAEAIQRICELAVATAKPNMEFNLKDTPKDKREIVFKALTDAIAQQVGINKFSHETAPIIIGYDKPRAHKGMGGHPMSGG
tara:strand:+ start:5818 stop:8841 length:3024 start_codon:yes stop_codon:yes gene_type:complete